MCAADTFTLPSAALYHAILLKSKQSKVSYSFGPPFGGTCPAGSEFFELSKQNLHTVNVIGTSSWFLELISSTWLSSRVREEFLFECMVHLYK